jgi:four helix bundle protein
MPTIHRFEEIEAWKTARELTNRTYQISEKGNFARDFGLRDQIRRASVSVMSNIADGFESRSQLQFIEYLGRAKASAGEVRAQLYITLDQNYLTQVEFEQLFDLAETCSRQIYRFMEYLSSQPNSRRVSDNQVHYET